MLRSEIISSLRLKKNESWHHRLDAAGAEKCIKIPKFQNEVSIKLLVGISQNLKKFWNFIKYKIFALYTH